MVPPIHMPLRREAANLSRMRSPAISRSNWANDSNTLRVSRPYGQRIETVEKTVSCRFRRSLAGCRRLRFLGKQLRIGWRGGRMDWARILAFVTGMVDQELLARIEYLAAENHILKAQLKGRLKL